MRVRKKRNEPFLFWKSTAGKGNPARKGLPKSAVRIIRPWASGISRTYSKPWVRMSIFSLMPRAAVKELITLCHEFHVKVDTGGFIEHVLTLGTAAVDRYIEECKRLEFDIVEISSGFLSMPADDLVRLTEKVQKAGLRAKAEIGIQFGAGGASAVEELEAEGLGDVDWAVIRAKKHLDAGAYMIMIESEGITESVRTWRTEVIAKFIRELGLEKTMFEAAEPEVFNWYVKNYGPEVNLFVDHSQIVLLESLRSGIWGTKNLWGRVHTYKGKGA
jgi:phosphosulfolactate synthase (CoM biosynthesis protein A)